MPSGNRTYNHYVQAFVEFCSGSIFVIAGEHFRLRSLSSCNWRERAGRRVNTSMSKCGIDLRDNNGIEGCCTAALLAS